MLPCRDTQDTLYYTIASNRLSSIDNIFFGFISSASAESSVFCKIGLEINAIMRYNAEEFAGVVELADARDSKSRVPLGRAGSTPATGTR